MVNDETLTRREFTPKPNAPTSYPRGHNGLVAVTDRPPSNTTGRRNLILWVLSKYKQNPKNLSTIFHQQSQILPTWSVDDVFETHSATGSSSTRRD